MSGDEPLADDEPGLPEADEIGDLLAYASELSKEVDGAGSDDEIGPDDEDDYGFYDDEDPPHEEDAESEDEPDAAEDEPDSNEDEEPEAPPEPAPNADLERLKAENRLLHNQLEALSRLKAEKQSAPQPQRPAGPDPHMIAAVRVVMSGESESIKSLDPVLRDRANQWIRQTNERQLQREFDPASAYGHQIAPFVEQHINAILQKRLAPVQDLVADRRTQQARSQLAPYQAILDSDPKVRAQVADIVAGFDTDSMKPAAVKKLLAMAVNQATGGTQSGRAAQKTQTRQKQVASNRSQRRSRGGRGRGRGSSKAPRIDDYTNLADYAIALEKHGRQRQ